MNAYVVKLYHKQNILLLLLSETTTRTGYLALCFRLVRVSLHSYYSDVGQLRNLQLYGFSNWHPHHRLVCRTPNY